MSGARGDYRPVAGQAGFTLVELLVVMLSATVIVGALFSLLDVTLHQTTTTFSRASATQSARVVSQRIEDELHSGCLNSAMAPVQSGSDGSDLIFVSLYGGASSTNPANGATPTPVEHKIAFTPAIQSASGKLTDYTYPATSYGNGTWTFSSTPSSTVTLLSNVSAYGSNPIFQYFAYTEPTNGGAPYQDAAGNPYMMIQDGINYLPGSSTIKPLAAPLASPLTTTSANTTAEVLVQFVAGPGGGSLQNTNLSNVGATVQDQVVLRITPVNNHVGEGATFTPCE